jgi:hypothetical protein
MAGFEHTHLLGLIFLVYIDAVQFISQSPTGTLHLELPLNYSKKSG